MGVINFLLSKALKGNKNAAGPHKKVVVGGGKVIPKPQYNVIVAPLGTNTPACKKGLTDLNATAEQRKAMLALKGKYENTSPIKRIFVPTTVKRQPDGTYK